MNHDWRIRVQPAGRPPFEFKATFVALETGRDERALDVSYLYGQGDLAVFLEDLGAGVPDIFRLIQSLEQTSSAEIIVDVSEEAMEVLAHRRAPGARAGLA